MITIYVKRIRSYMHGFLRYRNNKVMLCSQEKIVIKKVASSKNHAQFDQMVKTYTLFQTKTPRKPYRMALHIPAI